MRNALSTPSTFPLRFLLGLLALLIAASLPASAQNAEAAGSARPFLSPLFADNMVFQRGLRNPVWGWTTPGQKVTVRVNGKTVSAVADPGGKWIAKLDPLPVGGPYTVAISGPQSVMLNNVLSGDVWICSGQSNMEMGIGNVNQAETEIAGADYPQIRLFTVAKDIALEPSESLIKRSSDLMGQWSVCTPQTVKTGGWNGFSAVGYFFGRELYKDLKVPIGLIHTSWGGTPAEAWTSREALATMPDYRPALAQIKETLAASHAVSDNYAQKVADWYVKNDPGSVSGLPWVVPTFDASAWKTMTLPGNWEAAALPAYDGVVWFRKEFDFPVGTDIKDAVLHLGPIDDQDTTWVNGVQVGATGVYNTPRDYKIPASLLKPTHNVIVVRVLDTGGEGGFTGKPDQLSVAMDEGLISLAGAWQYKDSLPLAKAATPVPVRVTADQNAPTTLYNAMIAPLLPYGIKGAIWYQGESNAGKAYQYRTLLPTMIADWRARWGEGNFPFLIVQLANWQAVSPEPKEDAWAELREAQLMTWRKVPKTGMAVIIDIGDAVDIHPKDKQDVGKRLELAALAVAYDKKLVYSGPVYKAAKTEGNAVYLSFDHVGGGLVAGLNNKDSGKLLGFAIAGADRRFVWADAAISGDTITVSSPQVARPVAVRYAWAVNPVCNLYNRENLPATPFRTDDWPAITLNNK